MFDVIDLPRITNSPKLPLVAKTRDELSALGKVALFRATLEGERRFCGNDGEDLNGAPVEIEDREKIATLLDLRTVPCNHLSGRDDLRRECKKLLEAEYLRFSLRALEYAKEKEEASAAKIAAVKAVALKKPAGKSRKGAAEAAASEWSSDEEAVSGDEAISSDDVDEAAAEAARMQQEEDIKAEFKRVFKNYRKMAEVIDWLALSEELKLNLKPPKNGVKYDVMELWYVDKGKVIKHLCIDADPDRVLYGYLPKMATTSRGAIGALLAVSFCERINSVANQVVTKGNSVLGTDEISKIVVLRMNRDFMEYMREKHPQTSRQHSNMTVLRPLDSASDELPEDSEGEACL